MTDIVVVPGCKAITPVVEEIAELRNAAERLEASPVGPEADVFRADVERRSIGVIREPQGVTRMTKLIHVLPRPDHPRVVGVDPVVDPICASR